MRFLSALFLAVARGDGRGSISGDRARDVFVKVGEQQVSIEVEPFVREKRDKGLQEQSRNYELRLAIGGGRGHSAPRVWQDDGETKLESCIAEIAAAVFEMGEAQYREVKVWRHQNLLRRKHDLLEAELERRETEIRMAREREEKIRRDRLQKLLDDAAAYRQAEDIRQYVERVLNAVDSNRSRGRTQLRSATDIVCIESPTVIQRLKTNQSALTAEPPNLRILEIGRIIPHIHERDCADVLGANPDPSSLRSRTKMGRIRSAPLNRTSNPRR